MALFRSSGVPSIGKFQPELRVVAYQATRKDEPERGPLVRMSPADARLRLLIAGELAWVQTDRGQQLAEVVVDEAIAEHTCALRDVPGVMLAESVRVVKPDLDTPRRPVA